MEDRPTLRRSRHRTSWPPVVSARLTMEGVAGAALWLLSDLGKSTTGELVHVDAGFHIMGFSADDAATLKERLKKIDEAGQAQVSVLIVPDTNRELAEFAGAKLA